MNEGAFQGDETTAFLVIGAAAAAILTLFVVLMIRRERRRREAIEAAGREMRWTYTKEAGDAHPGAGKFNLFSRGRRRIAYNVLEGSRDGRDLWLFDYRYTTGSGKSTSTTHQTVMLVRSARLKLPAFALAPEHVFHKVGEMFGFRDIDFDASPEFSRRFRLIGEEEERLRLLCNSRVLSFFEERKGVAVEGSDHELLFYRGGRTVSPREIHGLVDETLELVTRLES